MWGNIQTKYGLIGYSTSVFGSWMSHWSNMVQRNHPRRSHRDYDGWAKQITTSLFSRALEIIVSKGNHPKMAQQFRWVKYDHLPRYIDVPQNFEVFGCSIYFLGSMRVDAPLFWGTPEMNRSTETPQFDSMRKRFFRLFKLPSGKLT